MPATAYPRPEVTVEQLSGLDPDTKLKALRDLKNQIIGNKTKKLNYVKLGAVPRVVDILASDTEPLLLIQSAATIGSFACGLETGVQAVLESGCLPHLLRTLSSKDGKVVEAGARSMKMIFQSPIAPRADMFKGGTIKQILALLGNEDDNLAEVAASILARCCETREHQQAVAATGAMVGVLRLLRSKSTKKKEASLDALAAITRENEEQCRVLLTAEGNPLAAITGLIRDKSSRMRLLACTCVANVSRVCPEYNLGQSIEGQVGYGGAARDVGNAVLGTLIKLVDDSGQVAEEAPAVLAHFISDNEDLQKAAKDADAVTKLARCLATDTISSRHKESVLNALAALCANREEGRRQLVDLKVLPKVVEALDDRSPGVRAAACACAKSLSRSVKNLRTSLVEAQIALPLFRLLSDPSPQVQAIAAATLCNMVLDFSPMKDVVLGNSGLGQLVELARSMDHDLRLNAVWAIKNLLFMADTPTKEKVIDEVTFPTIMELMQDPEEDIQEQALQLVRNLVYGKQHDIDLVVGFESGAILVVVERALALSQRPEVCLQALYVMCNVATGSEAHKEAVMASSVPANLLRFLRDRSQADHRVAAVWVVINLTYPEGPGVRSRVQRLQQLGIEATLQAMADDPCIDVKDRVKTALEQFSLQHAPPSPTCS